MVQYSFTSTETRRLVRTDSPGRLPRLSHQLLNDYQSNKNAAGDFSVPPVKLRCYTVRGVSARSVNLIIDDRLYSAILRSLEQTHCARMWFYVSD